MRVCHIRSLKVTIHLYSLAACAHTHAGNAPEYTQPLKELDAALKARVDVAGIILSDG